MGFELKEKNILIIGGDGTIGRSLFDTLNNNGANVWVTTRHPEKVSIRCVFLDLYEDIDIWEIPSVKFDIVFMCAAITSINNCINEPQITRKVNVVNTVKLATKLSNQGSFIIFLSTNAVFDGNVSYIKSNNLVNPQNEYGKQKAEAEDLLLSILKNKVAVVRLNKVITPDLSILINWINDLKDNKVIHPFYDMFMAPISLNYCVNVLCKVAETQISGIVQVSALNDISYAVAAKYIANLIEADEKLIEPISYKSIGIAFSSKHTTFDSNELVDLGFVPPESFDAFNEYFNL